MSTPRRDWPRSRGAPMIETGKVMAVSQRGTYLGRRDRAQAARRPHAGRAQAAFDGATLHGRGEVAQLVEHTAENRGVAGSSPALAISTAAPGPGLAIRHRHEIALA